MINVMRTFTAQLNAVLAEAAPADNDVVNQDTHWARPAKIASDWSAGVGGGIYHRIMPSGVPKRYALIKVRRHGTKVVFTVLDRPATNHEPELYLRYLADQAGSDRSCYAVIRDPDGDVTIYPIDSDSDVECPGEGGAIHISAADADVPDHIEDFLVAPQLSDDTDITAYNAKAVTITAADDYRTPSTDPDTGEVRYGHIEIAIDDHHPELWDTPTTPNGMVFCLGVHDPFASTPDTVLLINDVLYVSADPNADGDFFNAYRTRRIDQLTKRVIARRNEFFHHAAESTNTPRQTRAYVISKLSDRTDATDFSAVRRYLALINDVEVGIEVAIASAVVMAVPETPGLLVSHVNITLYDDLLAHAGDRELDQESAGDFATAILQFCDAVQEAADKSSAQARSMVHNITVRDGEDDIAQGGNTADGGDLDLYGTIVDALDTKLERDQSGGWRYAADGDDFE